MPGFAVTGVCYPTTEVALDAFVRAFPIQDASFMTYPNANVTPTISVTGVISLQLTRKNLATNSWTNVSTTVPLPVCHDLNSFDYVYAGQGFAMCFTVVLVNWYVAKNIGMILNAVRRW